MLEHENGVLLINEISIIKVCLKMILFHDIFIVDIVLYLNLLASNKIIFINISGSKFN